jgi:biopolymer transport protein ExbB
LTESFGPALDLAARGGPALWAIGALSVLTLAVILWKAWDLARLGAWSRGAAEGAVGAWRAGREDAACSEAARRGGATARLAAAAMEASRTLPPESAREETERVARNLLAEASSGLRALELVAAIAPLLGLFGTVLGMIEAFQTLQAAGARPDPSALAGGVWEALLTTAAGMAVAIPAAAALSWLESVVDKLRLSMEDVATRVFARPAPARLGVAAE